MNRVSFDDIIATYVALKVIEGKLREGPITLETVKVNDEFSFRAKQGDWEWTAYASFRMKHNNLPFLIRNIAEMDIE